MTSIESALARLEAIIDASAVPARIELLLPIGVRPRQLRVRTLLLGMLLCLSDARPAHLARVHEALIGLPEQHKQRLSVITRWKSGPHQLTYRQTERTFALVVKALAKQTPDGAPSNTLAEITDALLEASIQLLGCPPSSSLAIDWTDYESFARPPRKSRAARQSDQQPAAEDTDPPPDSLEPPTLADDGQAATPQQEQRCADPEASWGHRRDDGPGQRDEAFFGYYLQAATIVKEERGPEAAELTRRMLLTSCHTDPPGAFVPTIKRMAASGITLSDLLADSGYSYREPPTWALPLRTLGAALVQDLHPNDRGPKGTHMGAICANGNLYCPQTPTTLLQLGPLPPSATDEQASAHDKQTTELARYKLSPITAYDPDGYRRVACPATQRKLRCPLREASMALSHERATIATPPEHPPVCCTQQTLTVSPSVNAKTTQKHDYPSKAHRDSYKRRSAAERVYSTIKDPAANDISKGWCRLTGLTGPSLFLACLFLVRNTRIADAFQQRQQDDAHRRACGRPPRRHRKRRRTAPIDELINQANAPPA